MLQEKTTLLTEAFPFVFLLGDAKQANYAKWSRDTNDFVQ